MVVYHAASISRDFEDQGLKFLVGVSNVFDEEPPQLSTIGAVGTEVSTIGNSAFYSQYDWLGRRYFLNVTKTF
jgi:outer membrane receptor protein involved in Fe transport